MSDAAVADIVARLRAARELWVDLDDPPRRAVRLALPGWLERARMGGLPRLEFLQALMARVDAWRGFTWSDAGGGGEGAPPFSADLWDLLLDLHEPWIVRIVDAYGAVVSARADEAEAVSGN